MTEKSPSVTTASQGLARPPDPDSVRAKPAVLRALTDFFCMRDDPVPEEIENFRTVALELLGEAGASSRMYVAARLARRPGAPPEVLRFLARDDAACAQLLARHGLNLPLDAQVEMARTGDRRLACELAARNNLAPEVSAALVQRNDPVVTKALADNASAHITRETVRQLEGPGRPDRPLAADLEPRVSEPSVDPSAFFDASPLDRERIIASARAAALGATPATVLRDDDLLARLATHATDREWAAFAEALAGKLRIPQKLALRMTRDLGGEPLALLLACVGAAREETIRILLFCEPAISHFYLRVRQLANLAADVSPNVAGALVLAITGARPRLSLSHTPEAQRRRVGSPEPARSQQTPNANVRSTPLRAKR